MKSKAKVWILVVTVVVAVGVGIGVWVHYDRVHDQETASLVDHAVSSALAGVTTQPTEATTEPAATEATATTTTTTKPTTTKKKKEKHTTTQPQVVYRTERNGTVAPAVIVTDTRETTKQPTPKVPKAQQNSVPLDAIGEIIHSDGGDYWATATHRADRHETIYVDKAGRHFYFEHGDDSTPRIYID